MIYVSELYRHFYVATTTTSDRMEIEAVNLMPQQSFETKEEAEAIAQEVRQWAEKGTWSIWATARDTGKRFRCFTWRGFPSDGVRKAMNDAKEHGRDCFGFYAAPLINARFEYEEDCRQFPTYHDGTPRKTWEQLGELERSTWSK